MPSLCSSIYNGRILPLVWQEAKNKAALYKMFLTAPFGLLALFTSYPDFIWHTIHTVLLSVASAAPNRSRRVSGLLSNSIFSPDLWAVTRMFYSPDLGLEAALPVCQTWTHLLLYPLLFRLSLTIAPDSFDRFSQQNTLNLTEVS